jgi:hypothetical protein
MTIHHSGPQERQGPKSGREAGKSGTGEWLAMMSCVSPAISSVMSAFWVI